MEIHPLFRTKKVVGTLLVGGLLTGGIAANELIGSDHQQTALTELNPYLDLNDVYAFPGSADDRIALVATFSSPIVGNRTFVGGLPARFDPNALYQMHVDNNQDGIEDLVMQFSFDELESGQQTFDVVGPVEPRRLRVPGVGASYGFVTTTAPAIRRAGMNATATAQLAASGPAAAGQLQAWAGLRDDPFYVDLEQFFRIIPDRRPTTTELGRIGGVVPPPPGTLASSWRPACTNGTVNPGQTDRDMRFGCARDFLAGLNAMAIVVELPETQLTQGRGNGQLGIWWTVSR